MDSYGSLWHNALLRSNKEDVFRLIDTVFSVAAVRWPHDLKQRRDKIVENLYTISLTDTTHDQEHQRNESCRSNNVGLSGSNVTEKEEEKPVKKKKLIIIKPKIRISQDGLANQIGAENVDRTVLPKRVSEPDKLEASIEKVKETHEEVRAGKRRIQSMEFRRNTTGIKKAKTCN